MTNPRSTVEVRGSSTTVGFGFTGRPPFRRKRTFSKPPRVSFRFLKFSDSRGRRVFFFFANEPPLTRAFLSPLPDRSRHRQLAELYETHGQRWAEIARHLEGRTDQQCMGRWRRHLDPSVKKDAWTAAEDDKLMRLHDTLGPRWSNISKMLTGRTAQQCRARWFQLSAADDDATDGNASDATDGATVVTVTVGAASDEKRDGNAISRKKKNLLGAEKKTHSENMSPSTPSVTDEYGTVSAGAVSVGQVAGASSRKRAKDAEKKDSKRRKTLKDSFSSGETGGEKDGGSADYYGNGGGLDMLAMLYSAAVTYEQGVAAVTGSAPSLPAELHA
jgi:hypothetical protein